MILQDLKYFIALAQHLHFGRAAQSCFVSQPTLSIAIQKLEEELSVILFERYKSTVTLTELGQQLLLKAQNVIREMSQLEQLAQYHQDPLQGTFKLGCILGKGHCFRDQVLNICPDCYTDKSHQVSKMRISTFEGASLETIRHMVISGSGITILPETAAHIPVYLKAHLAVVSLQSAEAKRKIILVWREQYLRLKAILAIQKAVEGFR